MTPEPGLGVAGSGLRQTDGAPVKVGLQGAAASHRTFYTPLDDVDDRGNMWHCWSLMIVIAYMSYTL